MKKEIKKYNYEIPTKVYSKYLKEWLYVADGVEYFSLLNAFEKIYQISFYYQYNGDGVEEAYNHSHQHDFESVIYDLISNPKYFKIYEFQRQYFSNQEIKLLETLAKKLIQ